MKPDELPFREPIRPQTLHERKSKGIIARREEVTADWWTRYVRRRVKNRNRGRTIPYRGASYRWYHVPHHLLESR